MGETAADYLDLSQFSQGRSRSTDMDPFEQLISMSVPKVTIAIPVFNGQRFLWDSVNSALGSDFESFEVLALDDGSSDTSLSILNSISDRRLRVIVHERNMGLVQARRRLMSEARGQYLAWLDQDDIAYKHRIRMQVDFMLANKELVACGSFPQIRIENEGMSGTSAVRRLPVGHESVRAALPFFNPMNFSSTIIDLDQFRELNLDFREEFGNSLDYDLWSRIAVHRRIANIPKVLGEYRVHAHQTSQGEAWKLMLTQAWRVQRETLERDLGIAIPDAHEHPHYRYILDRSSLEGHVDSYEAAIWLRSLRQANADRLAYDPQAFDRVIAKQVLGIWAASGLAADKSSAFNELMRWKAISGVSWTTYLQAGVAAARNQLSQRKLLK